MTNGFVGRRKVVNEEDKKEVISNLENQIKEELITNLKEEVTSDFLVHYNDDSFSFEVVAENEKSETSVELTVRGTLDAFVFDTESIGTILASNTLSNVNLNETIIIQNPDDTTFNILETENEDKIEVAVKGQAHFVWQTNAEDLKSKLSGVPRKEMKDILQDFPSVTRAEAVVKPFWKKSFPKDSDEIEIIFVLDNTE